MTDLSMQLFSARNIELQSALQIVSEAGYRSVEAYGANFDDSEAFAHGLKTNGLRLTSCHVGIDLLENSLGETMERLSSFGTNHVVCPFLLPDSRPTDKAGWVQFADRLSRINESLVDNGFSFAWHNHDFEFNRMADGSMPMQVILESAPNIHWEIDIGWIVRAGLNPEHWLQNHGKRISAVHLKDVAAQNECLDEDGWADVGHGTIAWSELLADLKQTSAKLFIVEHDNPADFSRFAKNSFASISGWSW